MGSCYDVAGICIPAQQQGAALQAGFDQYAPKYKEAFGLEGWGPFEQFQVLYSMCGPGSGYHDLCSGTLTTALTEAWLGLPGKINPHVGAGAAAGCPTTDDGIGDPEPGGDPVEEGEPAELGAVGADEQVEAAVDPAGAAEVQEDRSLQAVLNSDDRTFNRYLTSLQSQAASGNSTLTPAKARVIWDEAIARGYTAPRGVETSWMNDQGGISHINLYPPSGPDIHFPVPDGWVPNVTGP
jgi:hypothetical protein